MQSTLLVGAFIRQKEMALSLFFWAYIFSLVVFNQNPGTGKEFSNMMFSFLFFFAGPELL